MKYIDVICETLDKVSNENRETYCWGDMNIDFFYNTNCPMRNIRIYVANVCNMAQVMTLPTRTFTNRSGITSTCVDHIFTNMAEHCSKAVSVALGCCDHNLVALTRKTPKDKRKSAFTGHSLLISLLPVLSQLLEEISTNKSLFLM